MTISKEALITKINESIGMSSCVGAANNLGILCQDLIDNNFKSLTADKRFAFINALLTDSGLGHYYASYPSKDWGEIPYLRSLGQEIYAQEAITPENIDSIADKMKAVIDRLDSIENVSIQPLTQLSLFKPQAEEASISNENSPSKSP